MLRLPNPGYSLHKAWLCRILTAFADNECLSQKLYFKGGTCAAFQDLLNRFSVDLDFDLLESKDVAEVKKCMENIFEELGLEIKDQSGKVPQYFLKYNAPDGERNNLKIDVLCPPPKSNTYETVRIKEIDRVWRCQTIETMFANKLVAVIDRYEKTKSIAGRDIYDIHFWLINKYSLNEAIIYERRGQPLREYLPGLIAFIEKHVTETLLSQDINMLLPQTDFKQIRKTLKPETIMLLRDLLQQAPVIKKGVNAF